MKSKAANQKIIRSLLLIPCAWAVVALFGGLDKLENALLDLRFQFRGNLVVNEKELPVLPASGKAPKVLYVDFDQRALSSPEAGERPWDRKFFAKVARILLHERIGARAVGYDFIFSNKSMSKMVLEENVLESEQAIGEVVAQHPGKVVLGANYSGVSFEFDGKRISSSPPLLYQEGYREDMARNYPEAPTYPIQFYKDGQEQGRLGMLFVEMPRSKGPIPRWAALHFPYKGDAHAKKQLLGLRFAHPIEQSDGEAVKALALANARATNLREEHQLLQALGKGIVALDKTGGELKQLEAAAKATPDTAAALQPVLEGKKADKAQKEKQLAALIKVCGEKESLAVLSKQLSQSENPLAESLGFIQTLAEFVQLQLAAADKEVEIARLQKDLVRAEPFVRGGLAFEEDVENGNWLLKQGDTVVERIPSVRENPHFFHFSISMILAAYELDWQDLEISAEKLIIRDKERNEIVHADLVDGQLLEVNWFSQWQGTKVSSMAAIEDRHNPRCSIIEVFEKADIFLNEAILDAVENYEANLEEIDQEIANSTANDLAYYQNERKSLVKAKADFKEAEAFFSHFRDAMILVGPVDPTFQDLAPTPLDDTPVPKVGLHGNLIKTLLSGKYLQRPPGWVEYAGIFAFGFLVIYLGFYSGPLSNWGRHIGIGLQILYLLAAFLAFENGHWIVPVAGPVGSALSASFAVFAVKLVIEEKAKGRIKGMFGTYVSQELVEQMVESGEEPSLGGEETPITAFFSDVQSFSSFSELLSPNQLVALMNEYLTAMTEIVQKERGTLDKYIGDAIVAMYGAPIPMQDHAYQAVKTALLMEERQLKLRAKWQAEGDKWPDIVGLMQTRIGCNTGNATVGNMGSTDRFNYTMMGDMVNLAARCESGAKAYGAYIMVTEETKTAAVATRDDIAYRYLDKIVVKGRTQPVSMHEPVGLKNDLSQETQDCLDCFGQGIEKYLAQDWGAALEAFEKAKGLEPNQPGVTPGVKDNPSMVLIDRCRLMRDNPPGIDWDGVFVMTSK